MKYYLSWIAVGLLTAAVLDPVMYSLFDQPIPWLRDLLIGVGGLGCLYPVLKLRHDL